MGYENSGSWLRHVQDLLTSRALAFRAQGLRCWDWFCEELVVVAVGDLGALLGICAQVRGL